VAAASGSLNLAMEKRLKEGVVDENVDDVNGEEVERRAREQQWIEFVRCGVSGVGFAMGVLGIWGDGSWKWGGWDWMIMWKIVFQVCFFYGYDLWRKYSTAGGMSTLARFRFLLIAFCSIDGIHFALLRFTGTWISTSRMFKKLLSDVAFHGVPSASTGSTAPS
jgi:hypothetical protein